MDQIKTHVLCLWMVLVGSMPSVLCADNPPDRGKMEAAKRMLSVFDVILTTHITPPSRQEMLLRGCRAMVPQEDLELQSNLARQISDLRSGDEMLAFLVSHLPAADHATFSDVEVNFITAALTAVPGGVRYSKAKDYAVEQQLRENRYVGIGIALSKDDGLPSMAQVIPGGPAHRAGGRDGDVMLTIEGENATVLSLPEIVEILRGQEGKPVSIVVRQPDTNEERTLDIVRGTVPFGSVEGVHRDENDEWIHRISDDVAYVKFTAVRGSSARDLKQTAKRLHAAGFRALILELRTTNIQGDLRHAAMIADGLLGQGKIGASATTAGREDFESSVDQLFAGWPLVVLVGARTAGQAECIAAALQDNERATVLGQATLGQDFVQHAIQLKNGDAIEFRSGLLERASGRLLVSRGRMAGVERFGQVVRVFAAKTPKRDVERPEGWNGVQPDQLVTNRQSIEKAVAVLSELLEPAAEAVAQ